MERINKCIGKLAFNFNTLWFLDVLYNINIQVMDTDRCPSPTACVMYKDFKINMFFNRDFIDKLNDDELLGLILHETLHLALYHNVRNHGKEAKYWNIACDLEVNSIIKLLGFTLPDGGLLPEDYKLEQRLSSEMYYDIIYKDTEQRSIVNAKGNQNILDDHSTWSKSNGEKDLMKQISDQVIQSAIAENKKDIDSSPISRNIAEGLSKANDCKSKTYGKTPGDAIQKIKVLGEGTVKWNYILNRLIRRTLSANYIPSFKRTSRRYGELVKGKIKNHKIDNIIVAVDTSGSIDTKLHEKFMKEIILIRRMFKIDIRYIQCDTEVVQDIKLKRYTNIENIEIKGGGGTDFRPVFDYIKEKNYNPNAILYFTDGCGQYPKRSNIDTLWILSEEPSAYYQPPFGYKLFLNEKIKKGGERR